VNRARLLLLAPALAFIASACRAPYTQIERRVEAATVVPDVYCVLEKLRDASSSHSLTYTTDPTPAGVRHTYVFLISRDYYSWSLLVKPDGTVAITTSTGVDDSSPTQLPVVRDRLLKVESGLRNQCGLQDVMDRAVENCQGKACTAI
jgi:hypothetical protein